MKLNLAAWMLGLMIAAACASAACADPVIKPVHFAKGTSSATIRGAVISGDHDLYAIKARQGQQLSVHVTATEENAVFQIYGPIPDGMTSAQPDDSLGEPQPGAAEGDDAMQWSGKLPQSGRYLIVVGPSRGNATYRLTVAVH